MDFLSSTLNPSARAAKSSIYHCEYLTKICNRYCQLCSEDHVDHAVGTVQDSAVSVIQEISGLANTVRDRLPPLQVNYPFIYFMPLSFFDFSKMFIEISSAYRYLTTILCMF